MLRIALVGAGRTVIIGHAPALQALPDLYQVVAITDRSPAAADEAGMLLGVAPDHRYTDYHQMLALEDLDVVSISVPHAYHHEVALQALQVDAHVICERPLALSVPDAQEVLRVAETRGKLVTVLHYLLYYPPFREAIRLVSEGAIGEPFFVRCEGVTGGYGAGTATYHPAWHGDPEIAGGGVWLDSGYHNAYLCVSLLGVPVSKIAARIGIFATDLPVDDTAVALLTHDNGSISDIQVAWSVPSGGQRVFEIYGTEGSIVADHDGFALGVYNNHTRSWHHPQIITAHAESFIGIYRAIHQSLRFGAAPPVSHRDALHTLEIVTTGYRASDNGATERIGGGSIAGEMEEQRFAA